MKLIVALDVDNINQAEELIEKLKNKVEYFKVGSKLFTREGPAILNLLNKKKCKTFLDLKYYDIPSVIADAVRIAGENNVYSTSLHISGGSEMLQKCKDLPKRPLLWGITVLTSFDERNLREIGIDRDIEEQVVLLAKLAKEIGLDGVVSSPREIPIIKKIGSLQIIVPGVRMETDEKGDQKRTLTPRQAKELGADFIVVGRPIIKAQKPVEVAEKILQEIKE